MKTIFALMVLVFMAPMAMAQSLGIKFDQMPVGTKLHYKDYEGDQWTDVFLGKKGKNYVLRRKYKGDSTTYKIYYTLDGHMKRFQYRAGWSANYEPHYCEQVLGSCQYRYRGNPTYNGTYLATVTKKGNAYEYSEREVSSDETWETMMTFGQFNLIVEETWKTGSGKTRWTRLVKIEAP